MKELRFYENNPEIRAGFYLAPCDNPEIRQQLLKEQEAKGLALAWPRQCHTANVASLHKEDVHPGLIEIPETDGVITDQSGVLLTSSHADCLPIYMYDPKRHAIGLAHSGWRGCLDCIGLNMLYLMEDEYGCDPEDIITYIGPGIGYCCFEVDEDVMEVFTDAFPWAEDEFVSVKKISAADGSQKRKYNIDLKALVSEYLQMEGIRSIEIDPHCTCCGGEDYWSFRRNGTPQRHLAYMELL